MGNIIEIEGLTKSFFDETVVIKETSIVVKEGDIFGLVGLNGVGKTTLIRCILDFVDIDAGSIKIFGRDYKDFEIKKQIAFLPDNFRPSKLVTGYEFIKFYCDIKSISFDKQKVNEIAQKLDLDVKYLSYKTSECSKGTVQKIGLVSCIVSDPKLLILDEPMNGLDVRARLYLKKILKSLVPQSTIMFSSHILSDIEEICDTIGIFHDKTFKFTGNIEEFRNTHQNRTLEEAFVSLTI